MRRRHVDVLWRFFYAMLMRDDEHKPSPPTREQWVRINESQRARVTRADLVHLEGTGLLVCVTGGSRRLTRAGLNAIGIRT